MVTRVSLWRCGGSLVFEWFESSRLLECMFRVFVCWLNVIAYECVKWGIDGKILSFYLGRNLVLHKSQKLLLRYVIKNLWDLFKKISEAQNFLHWKLQNLILINTRNMTKPHPTKQDQPDKNRQQPHKQHRPTLPLNAHHSPNFQRHQWTRRRKQIMLHCLVDSAWWAAAQPS